jgi:hypothetical protein
MPNLYINPQFVNGSSPPLSAQNMNNLANCAQANQSYDIAITATASAWNSSNTQTITATGVKSTTEGILVIARTATEAQANAAQRASIRVTAQANNSITIRAYGSKPTVDIPLVIKVMSDGSMNTGAIISAISGGKHETEYTVTLSSSGWNNLQQTVSVADVTASNRVEVSPGGDFDNYTAYVENFIVCTAQASGTLTFTCASVPSTNITVNVVVCS